MLAPFTRQRLRMLFAAAKHDDLEALSGLTPAIDRTFPLADAADAIDYLTGGHARGKVVLTI
jgi:NADPH:quinone reductase-like Zn-dependent oxidoreductase